MDKEKIIEEIFKESKITKQLESIEFPEVRDVIEKQFIDNIKLYIDDIYNIDVDEIDGYMQKKFPDLDIKNNNVTLGYPNLMDIYLIARIFRTFKDASSP